MSDNLMSILKDVDADIGGDGALPTEWISTGNYVLNKLMSGSVRRGVPVGRVVTFAGDSGTGKSLLAACCMREAQKQGFFCIVFDSEAALDKNFLSNLGVDTSKLAIMNTDTVEEFRLKMVKILEGITDEKVLFVLDSMGNLATKKELNDALDGKSASDMGLKAKSLRATFRVISNMINKKNASLIVTNHTYTDASGYIPMQVMSAGKGLFYNSSIVMMLTKARLKDGKEQVGITIKVKTEKNRFVPPFKMIGLDLNFVTGMTRFTGLLDVLVDQGLITRAGSWYSMGEEKFQKKNFDEWAEKHEEMLLDFDVPSSFAHIGDDSK